MASTERTGGFALRPLTPHDVDAGARLSAEAGWNQNESDWAFILENGAGWGVHDHRGFLGATAAVIPYGEAIAWICMVLVTAPWRRQGMATALLSRCIEHAEAAGWVAGLDATENGRKTYLPLGFRDRFPLERFVAEPAAPGQFGSQCDCRQMTGADLAEVIRLDAAASGVDRSRLIAHLFARAPEMAWLSVDGGRPTGFCLGRDGREADQIGPVVAANAGAAIALTQAALESRRDPSRRVYVDALTGNGPFNAWLTATGFRAQRSFTRMFNGQTAAPDHGERSFAIAGPELS